MHIAKIPYSVVTKLSVHPMVQRLERYIQILDLVQGIFISMHSGADLNIIVRYNNARATIANYR